MVGLELDLTVRFGSTCNTLGEGIPFCVSLRSVLFKVALLCFA